jgi:hypothetical protein
MFDNVGSSRHGVLGRVLMGDDARASLNGAPCAVAAAPLGYAHSASVYRSCSPSARLSCTAVPEKSLPACYDVDLLVVGSCGNGPAARFLNGSVSNCLVRHAA